MRSIRAFPSFIRRAALVAGVVALGLATVAPTQAFAQRHPDKKNPTINTYGAWDGSSNVVQFGCPNTTTYGQVITVPAGKSSLDKYKFWLSDLVRPARWWSAERSTPGTA